MLKLLDCCGLFIGISWAQQFEGVSHVNALMLHGYGYEDHINKAQIEKMNNQVKRVIFHSCNLSIECMGLLGDCLLCPLLCSKIIIGNARVFRWKVEK